MLPLTFITHLSDFRRDLLIQHIACEQTGEHPLLYQGRIADFGVYARWALSPEPCLICMSFDLAVPGTSIPLENHSRRSQEVAPEVLNQNGHGKPVDLWSIGYGYLLS